MTPARRQILKLLETTNERYPEWRFGQMVANIAAWARQPSEPNDSGVWDVEDEEFLAALRAHLERLEAAQTK